MKRIVHGKAYDTNTSAVIARKEYGTDYENRTNVVDTLYRTPGGAFFVVEETETVDDNGDAVASQYRFETYSAARAQQWVLEGDVELLDKSFVEVPEAVAETAEPQATFYIRAPAALKRRVEAATTATGLSINAFVLRALEVEVEASELRKVEEVSL